MSEKIKVIFLDIDGVLNTNRPKDGDVSVPDGSGILNTHLIELLNKLTDNTGAKIVISSTWRKLYSQKELSEVLNGLGVTAEIIGMTGNSDHGVRGVEISQWLNGRYRYVGEHPNSVRVTDIENYIILDDDSDMLLKQANHFYNTDYSIGLTEKIVYKASNFLNGVTFF